MNSIKIDPAMNLLHNDQVMGILQETIDRLEALGVVCLLVPGGLRPRDDQALPISLFVAPNEDSLLDLRAGDNLATDMAMTVQGHAEFEASRAFLKAQDLEFSESDQSKS
jgi:hypothetical protein